MTARDCSCILKIKRPLSACSLISLGPRRACITGDGFRNITLKCRRKANKNASLALLDGPEHKQTPIRPAKALLRFHPGRSENCHHTAGVDAKMELPPRRRPARALRCHAFRHCCKHIGADIGAPATRIICVMRWVRCKGVTKGLQRSRQNLFAGECVQLCILPTNRDSPALTDEPPRAQLTPTIWPI